MLIVDTESYGKEKFTRKFKEWSSLAVLSDPENRLFAVCLKHPFDIVSLVLYLRDCGGSVLLLHGDTPLEAAMELARKAGCFGLIHTGQAEICGIGGATFNGPPSLCQFSSGTTGEPKLIARAWHEVDLEIKSYNGRLNPESGERPVILVPVSHSFGLVTGVLASLARGTEPVVVNDKNPKFAVRLLKSTNKSIVYAVPFLLQLLRSLGRDQLKLHKLISSGAPLNEAILGDLRQNSEEVWQQYGCTEAGCISLGADPISPADVGEPLPHLRLSMKAVPESGVELGRRMSPIGAQEIVVHTPYRIISTNDLGLFRDNRLQLLGRIDDLINVSGLKVIPFEVESVIGRLPGVTEAVVYGMRHPIQGDMVKALVVATPDIGKEAVKEWCLLHLPPYKVPGVIEMVDLIPRPPSGKISRKYLRERES